MAKLQREDAKMLWEEMGEDKSWKSLVQVLQNHLEQSKGMEDSTVKALLGEAKHFQQSKEVFPGSRTQMLQILNEHIEEYRDQKGKEAQKSEHRQNESSGHTEKRQQHEAQTTRQKNGKAPQASHRQEHAQEQGQESHVHQERRAQSAKSSPAAGPIQQQAEQRTHRTQRSSDVGKMQNKGREQKMAAPQKADPGERAAYQPAHMQILFTRGKWKSWDEIILWLQQSGHIDGAFGDVEVQDLIRDIQFLRDSGVPFTPNHEQAFQLIHSRRK